MIIRKKIIERKMCVIVSTFFVSDILILGLEWRSY
jgi:hypothetical protein